MKALFFMKKLFKISILFFRPNYQPSISITYLTLTGGSKNISSLKMNFCERFLFRSETDSDFFLITFVRLANVALNKSK